MTAGPSSDFRLRDVWLAAYGPSLVASVGYGAVGPVLALQARALGASYSTAALIVALMPLGMLLASLPSGAVIARIGERRMLVWAGVVDAVAMAGAALAPTPWLLGAAALVSGVAWTAFLIARQGFMILAVPMAFRARAMSLLGGTFRVGVLVGPVLGAGLIHWSGLPAVFWLACGTSLAAGLLAAVVTDLGEAEHLAATAGSRPSVWSVLREHRRVLLVVGTAVIVIGASRSVRTSLLPLWADFIGLPGSTVSLIFAFTAAIDLAFLLPGGWVMDRVGRTVVAVPVVLSVAVGALLLPLTDGPVGVTLVMSLIALGNGLGSGIVMTLGADTAPTSGRSQFLGGWRLCGAVGTSSGPLLVSGAALVAPLAVACVVIGVLSLLGTAWVAYAVLGVDRRLRVTPPGP